MTINADGVPNIWGKVFNQQYPGPWIGKALYPLQIYFSSAHIIVLLRGMLG